MRFRAGAGDGGAGQAVLEHPGQGKAMNVAPKTMASLASSAAQSMSPFAMAISLALAPGTLTPSATARLVFRVAVAAVIDDGNLLGFTPGI